MVQTRVILLFRAEASAIGIGRAGAVVVEEAVSAERIKIARVAN